MTYSYKEHNKIFQILYKDTVLCATGMSFAAVVAAVGMLNDESIKVVITGRHIDFVVNEYHYGPFINEAMHKVANDLGVPVNSIIRHHISEYRERNK